MRTRARIRRAAAPGRRAANLGGPAPPAAAHAPRVREILHRPRLLPKLTVGPPGDAFEREADQVAAEVMRMPEPAAEAAPAAPAPPAGGPPPPAVRRLCPACEETLHRAPATNAPTPDTLRRAPAAILRRAPATNAPTPETLRRAPAAILRRAPATNAPTPETTVEEEEPAPAAAGQVARKAAGGAAAAPGPALEEAAARAVAESGAGRPLADSTRRFFEPRLSADLSGVRLYEGPRAAESAARLGARAFAFGSRVWLGAGEREGNRALLAHELVHVLQARGGTGLRTVRRYTRTNTLYLWDVYDAAGRDPARVSDADLRTTIEYEDYRRADLTWKFSDTVALAALRRSMDLFVAGVRGRGPNYIRAGRETRAAAHGIESIFVTELGFTGDHMITKVPGALGTATGSRIDDPDGSSPVWSMGGPREFVAYTLGTPPTMFARFSVVPPVAAPVPNVQVRALAGGTQVGQASGLTLAGGAIESAAGGGVARGIGGGAAVPGAHVGLVEPDIEFETSTDGGRIWFRSGSAQPRLVFTAAAPSPPGGVLREDVLDWGSLVIGSGATPVERLRRLVKTLVTYNHMIGMPPDFATSDAVMTAFTTPHQCDSQAYLLRYLARSFGIPAEVVYFWYGTPTETWHYKRGFWLGPTFQCDRPAEDLPEHHPHFNFHALAEIGGVLHDAAYDFTGLPGILEHAPGATPQTGPRASYFATTRNERTFICPH